MWGAKDSPSECHTLNQYYGTFKMCPHDDNNNDHRAVAENRQQEERGLKGCSPWVGWYLTCGGGSVSDPKSNEITFSGDAMLSLMCHWHTHFLLFVPIVLWMTREGERIMMKLWKRKVEKLLCMSVGGTMWSKVKQRHKNGYFIRVGTTLARGRTEVRNGGMRIRCKHIVKLGVLSSYSLFLVFDGDKTRFMVLTSFHLRGLCGWCDTIDHWRGSFCEETSRKETRMRRETYPLIGTQNGNLI